jgi:hypothetical protein
MADAPSNQEYLLNSPDSSGLLTLARVLTADANDGIQLQDSGAGQTLNVAPSAMLASVQGLSTNGIICRTATNTATTRVIDTDVTINVNNDDGVSGNPTIGVNDDSNIQKVIVQSNGTEVAARSQLNLIPAGSIDITAIEDPENNRINVTISGSAAPIDAPIWVSEANGTLSNEVNLGALTTGMLKHTVTAGYSTPATAVPGTDYLKPAQATTSPTTLLESGTKMFWGSGTGNLVNLGGSSQSVAIGVNSFQTSTSCNASVGVGFNTFAASNSGAEQCVGIGHSAGAARAQYINSTFVGKSADASASGLENITALGYNAVASQSNMVLLGNSARTCINIANPGAIASSPYGLQLGTDSGTVKPQIYMSSSTSPTPGDIPAQAGVYSVANGLPIFTSTGGNYNLAAPSIYTASFSSVSVSGYTSIQYTPDAALLALLTSGSGGVFKINLSTIGSIQNNGVDPEIFQLSLGTDLTRGTTCATFTMADGSGAEEAIPALNVWCNRTTLVNASATKISVNIFATADGVITINDQASDIIVEYWPVGVL